MAEESTKKRKRRRRSKEKTEDDAEVKEEEAPAEKEVTDHESDDEKGADERSDGKSQVKTEAAEEDDDEEADGDGDEPKKRKRKRKRKKAAETDAPAAEKAETPSNPADSTSHTVFIEGLPFTSTPSNVRYFFEQHGCADIVEMRLPTWQDSGRLRGFGHVVFGSLKTKQKALSEVNGKELGGRYVTVQEAKAPKAGTSAGSGLGTKVRDQPEGCKTVFVRNLPYEATEDDILENFRVCGKVLEGGVRIARNHSTGQSKGFGYVEYKNTEGAYAAVQKAAKPFGLKVMGRPVFVDYDEGAMKGSFRNKDGKLWSKEHGDRGGKGRGGGAGRGHR